MMRVSLKLSIIGALLALAQATQAAEIRVLCTGAAKRSFEALAPQFERATGHQLVAEFGLPPALVRKMDAGEPFDVMILSYDVDGLIKQGKLVPDSRTVLGRYGIGIAIPQRAPKPEFRTVEAFKRSLLAAKAIATSGEGSSGRHVASLLVRLGIANEVKPKIKTGGSGSAAQFLSKREVDFAVIGLPPLIGVPNIEWLGYLPDEINSWLAFSGGLNVRAKEPEAGRTLLRFLTTPAATAVWKANGLEPAL